MTDAEKGGVKIDLTYDSIKNQIKEKWNHPIVSFTLIVFLILDVAILVVGSIKKDDCPVEEKIPIFLIVAGSVGIISKLLPFIYRKLQLFIIGFIIFIIYVFSFVWLIVGSVWVYSIYEPQYDSISPSYCNKTVYLFAFSMLTIRWILLGISLLFGFCSSCLIISMNHNLKNARQCTNK